jgi:Uma2 family endonuclease
MRLLDPPHVHQWTHDEYYKMAEAGLFEGKHVELIEGRIIEMSPMGSTHATGVSLAGDTIRSVVGPAFLIRSQMPLDLGDLSEPEPDIAVVGGTARDYTKAHPKDAVLIVEVSESSLDYDRTEKASLYAAAEIPDYLVLNLIGRRLEVRRDPVSRSERAVWLRLQNCNDPGSGRLRLAVSGTAILNCRSRLVALAT